MKMRTVLMFGLPVTKSEDKPVPATLTPFGNTEPGRNVPPSEKLGLIVAWSGLPLWNWVMPESCHPFTTPPRNLFP